MLERLRELHSRGLSEREITNDLFLEFGAPRQIGEVKAELMMLKSGSYPSFHSFAQVYWCVSMG